MESLILHGETTCVPIPRPIQFLKKTENLKIFRREDIRMIVDHNVSINEFLALFSQSEILLPYFDHDLIDKIHYEPESNKDSCDMKYLVGKLMKKIN